MSAVTAALWRQFICKACGLIYDEAQGDADSGLAPGTRFDDIPDDWACPLCGVTKADFEPYEVPVAPRRTVRNAVVSTHGATHGVPPANRMQRGCAGIVIVGAGRAGWQVAQALREADADVPLTIVTACAGDVYDKPTLSVACARGIAPQALVREAGMQAARRLRVRLLANTHAVSIDAGARRLRTTRGTLRYARLVLAHGATPSLPPALPPALCWRINDLAAYQRLRAALGATRRHVVIVGAGLVGSELANDLASGGHAVTLLDLQTRPLAAQVPELASRRLLDAWQGMALRFVGGVQVKCVEACEGMLCVTTTCGRTFTADQVIAATGLHTPARLAHSAGLLFDSGGVAVDTATLRTSDPLIHALGDCASVAGQVQRYIEPITRQAQAIAAAVVGSGSAPFVPKASMLRVKTGALPITVHGQPVAGGVWAIDTDSAAELRMTQHVGGVVAAWLVALRPGATVSV